MIDLATSADAAVRDLLSRHSRVREVDVGTESGVEFVQGGRTRCVRVGDPTAEVFGLVELMDNNPLVCAAVVSVPSPAATLALIALGPAAASGLIADTPAMVTNLPADREDIEPFLRPLGWDGGMAIHVEPRDLEGVGTAAMFVSIWTPEQMEEVNELYDERYGRSFYVMRDGGSVWDAPLVRGTPCARYRLSVTPDHSHSLLTIRCLADVHGKLGAAQVVHAMNVMCGFEETLGIS